jgi:hypothetical protein
MKNLIAYLVVSVLSGATFATTWTVDDDGKADFDNIQAAVDAASDGDEIIVMPGTYTSTQDAHVVNMLGKAVTLRSSDPSNPDVVAATIIDGEGRRGRVIKCTNGETNKTVFEGLTITGGNAMMYGGGFFNYSSNPTVTNCIFSNNTTEGDGAGMCNLNNSNPIIADCIFKNNSANGNGGGMYNDEDSNPTLNGCTFENNTATESGGGMYNFKYNGNNSNPTLTGTTVCGNTPDQIWGDWTDNGGNTIADVCPIDCPDINGDGYVNVSDLLAIIDQWGLTNSPADVNTDGIVDVSDLLIVVGNWGPCE